MTEQRAVSFSELDCFRQCPMKWDLAYRRGFKPAREKEAFRLGHAWHSVMEMHYRVIREYQQNGAVDGKPLRSPKRGTPEERGLLEACAKAVGEVVLDNVEDDDTHALMTWAYAGYVEMYGCDPNWLIKEIEIREEVILPGTDVPFVFVIDLVVEDLDYGGTWIIDHKFPGDLATDTEIELDDQLGLYWGAWIIFDVKQSGKATARGARVNGAMLNESRKKRNVGDYPGATRGKAQTLEQRFRRTRTNRNHADINDIMANAVTTVRAMQLLTEHGLLFNSPNPKQCTWKCDFKEPHIMQRGLGIPIEEVLSDFGFTSREERQEQERKEG